MMIVLEDIYAGSLPKKPIIKEADAYVMDR